MRFDPGELLVRKGELHRVCGYPAVELQQPARGVHDADPLNNGQPVDGRRSRKNLQSGASQRRGRKESAAVAFSQDHPFRGNTGVARKRTHQIDQQALPSQKHGVRKTPHLRLLPRTSTRFSLIFSYYFLLLFSLILLIFSYFTYFTYFLLFYLFYLFYLFSLIIFSYFTYFLLLFSLIFSYIAITLASALLDDRTLKELYQYLNSLSIANSTTTTTEFKHQDQVTSRNYSGNEQFNIFSSLKMSLDLSWKTLEQRNDDSCRFFALMGLLPSGVGEEEFEKIWGKDWDIYKDILLRSSLLLKLKKNETTQYRLYYSFALNRNYFQKGIHS